MESKPIRVRRTKSIDRALSLIEKKFPDLDGDTEKLQRVAEQWVNLQDAGTSKTQKMIDIDTKLTEHSKALLELTQTSLSVVDRVFKLETLVKSIYDIVLEMKGQVQEHGYE